MGWAVAMECVAPSKDPKAPASGGHAVEQAPRLASLHSLSHWLRSRLGALSYLQVVPLHQRIPHRPLVRHDLAAA